VNRFLAGASLALLWSCGADVDDDETPNALGAPPIHPVPGCESIDHRACDIAEAACRDRLMLLAACLRGSEPLAVPPVTTMTTTEYAAVVNARLAADPPPDPNHYERALTLLGLVEPGELSETMIGPDDVSLWGQYRSEEKDILIIEQEEADNIASNHVLVHEFVHALQDRELDLASSFDEFVTSYDSYLGYASVVEGEARMHEVRFTASLLGLDPADIDWGERFQNAVELGEAAILSEPSAYSKTYGYFPYSLGARFVHHAWLDSGSAGVSALLRAPPARAHAVMDSLFAVAVDDWPEPAFVAPTAPASWTLWGDESLGAWGLLLARTRMNPSQNMRQTALDWRGDHLYVYVDDAVPEQTTMAWNIELASVSSATRVEAIARGISMHVARSETRVVIAGSTGTNPVDWALVP